MNEITISRPGAGALDAKHYASYEIAKVNDDVLGGDNIAQIRSYAAYARAQAQAIHKTIAATSGIDDVAAIKAEATETAQTFAKVGIYADQRIGEILRELPKGKAGRKPNDSTAVEELPTKAQALKESGISTPTAYQLEQLAANPEVVQAVLDRAEAEGRIPSRKQVLDAIKERDDARETVSMVQRVSNTLKRERDEAREDIEQYQQDVETLQAEVRALEQQNDKLYAQKNPKPQIVEREVVREVESEESKRRIAELEHLERVHCDDNQKLRRQLESTRKELDRAKVLLKEKGHEDNASWDISALTTATNQYLRSYGGKAWAFDQFYRVDEVTQAEFTKAITSLAAFSQNLVQMISDQNKLGA